jgi:hypothetical protein
MKKEQNLQEPQQQALNIPVVSGSLYAKCCFSECLNKAEWFMGTWQCCDECAKKWITETEKGWGYAPWGTSSRAGQEAVLKHNLQYNLKHYLVGG